MDIADWYNDERKFTIVMSAILGVGFLGLAVTTPRPFSDAWVQYRLVCGVLAVATCIGLWQRREWSRWSGMIGFLLMSGLFANRVYLEGVSWLSAAKVLGVVLVVWHIWSLPISVADQIISMITSDSDFLENAHRRGQEIMKQERWKVALLLSEPRTLSPQWIADVAQEVFGVRFSVIDGEIDPTDAMFLPTGDKGPVVAGEAPVLVCCAPPHLLGVVSLEGPYSEFLSMELDSETLNRGSLPEHAAFVEIEMLPHAGDMEAVEEGYAISGKLAAAMVSAETLAVCLPGRDSLITNPAEFRAAVSSDDPAAAIAEL